MRSNMIVMPKKSIKYSLLNRLAIRYSMGDEHNTRKLKASS